MENESSEYWDHNEEMCCQQCNECTLGAPDINWYLKADSSICKKCGGRVLHGEDAAAWRVYLEHNEPNYDRYENNVRYIRDDFRFKRSING